MCRGGHRENWTLSLEETGFRRSKTDRGCHILMHCVRRCSGGEWWCPWVRVAYSCLARTSSLTSAALLRFSSRTESGRRLQGLLHSKRSDSSFDGHLHNHLTCHLLSPILWSRRDNRSKRMVRVIASLSLPVRGDIMYPHQYSNSQGCPA
jgi:hypothetical protein